VKWKEAESGQPLSWRELPDGVRESLRGKLAGLWNAADDQRAFDSLSIDKQQALLLIVQRLTAKDLWRTVKAIKNVYGVGGVGIDFEAWPYLASTLTRRKDFTSLFAKRKAVSGGFYETGRATPVLHFLYQDGSPRLWHVHFDLFSPLYSVGTALKHWRHEFLGKVRPNWKMVREALNEKSL
jgi:hypothetical protein